MRLYKSIKGDNGFWIKVDKDGYYYGNRRGGDGINYASKEMINTVRFDVKNGVLIEIGSFKNYYLELIK